MNYIKNNVTLVVSSCDKYEDAWYQYFSLIKKYWKNHPDRIALITETKSYSCDGLNISVFNTKNQSATWSERLYACLDSIDTEYIIFSLEDFFLLDNVNENVLEQCYEWMESNSNIAVCRLYSSEDKKLIKSDKYGEFRIADKTIGYRLDTQAALWRRKDLMSFIDLKENPWQFEEDGTKRIENSEKLFLWHYCETLDNVDNRVFPYQIFQKYGYGIAWGQWLWKNKEWFAKNDIQDVNYRRLGSLSRKAVFDRFNHLYSPKMTRFDKIRAPFWRMGIRIKKVRQNILTLGLKRGIKESWNSIK